LGEPVEIVCSELAVRFGHFQHGPTGVLDHFFTSYLEDRRPRQSLVSWISTAYDKRQLEASFKPTSMGRWLTDRLLKRE
jgi:hypothetical protein